MKLSANWREVLMHAWSVRLILIAAVLSGVDAALPFLRDFIPIDAIPFALLSFAVSVGALIARIIPQKGLSDG